MERFVPNKTLNIFLGYACNLNCSYCLQHTKTGVRQIRDIKPEVVRDWIAEIRLRGITDVAYWGGEPILYWEKIVEIHEAFLAAGLTFNYVKFVTNGTLIEDHHVEILNRWGAFVVISDHEKFGTPRWDVLAKLKRCSVSFLFTHQELTAWDFIKRLDELAQKHDRMFYPYAHWAHATKSCSEDMRFTMDDLPTHEAHLRELADRRLEGDFYASAIFEGHLVVYQREMKRQIEGRVMCCGDTKLAVDLEGRVYSCHHATTEANLINTSLISKPSIIQRENALRAARFVNSAKCRSCRVRFYCQGGCHQTLTHDVECALTKIRTNVFDYIIEKERK